MTLDFQTRMMFPHEKLLIMTNEVNNDKLTVISTFFFLIKF